MAISHGQRLGGNVIGHTNATDCIMAREAGMCLATFAGVATLGAGLSDHDRNAHGWHEPRLQQTARLRQIVGEMTRSLRGNGSDAHVDCRCATAGANREEELDDDLTPSSTRSRR
ncbi:hypothetical protein [Streptomyces sp. NPDC056663]|uniref:hypothetical protein n=1 Tax=Streptomyces sp. NPDC056663 TaxID=3345899 RepID=UPI00369810B2